MRVVILGEDAPGGLMASYARGFTEIGVDVRTFCLARMYNAVLPAIRTRAFRRVAERLLLGAFNERVVKEVSSTEADLVLVIKGHRLNAAAVDAIRESAAAPVVNFYPDDPFSTERSNRLAYGPAVLAAYDACFTFARHLVASYERVGVQATHYLPFARDPAVHAPIPDASPPAFDVVFVGNLDEERVTYLDAVATNYRVAVFGERTRVTVPRSHALARATFGPPAYGSDLARALATGAISINVMRQQNAHSHNMRSFESPACGAFTLSQRTPELGNLFVEGDEIACFESVEELRDAVARWRPDDRGRATIARAGFARVRDDTYARRACTILERAGVAAGVSP